MQILLIISCLLMAGCTASTDTSTSATNDDIKLTITESFFKENFVIYTGQHDIVKIFVPFNKYNIRDSVDSSSGEEQDEIRRVFFVEADIVNGKRTDQGLYVYKHRKATKILDNGRDAAATSENIVYIGASDGIYKYDEATNSAAKHGNVTDDILQMAHNNVTNAVYYLTANHEVFKLNADATAGVKISSIKDVQALVFGYEGNMYYYDTENNVYVLNDDTNGIPKKVQGLPSKIDKITLISPLNGMEEGAVLIVDKSVYRLDPNATSMKSFISLEVEPTAFAPQTSLVQYYAKDKKIYEYNMFAIVLGNVLNELKNFIANSANALRSFANGF